MIRVFFVSSFGSSEPLVPTTPALSLKLSKSLLSCANSCLSPLRSCGTMPMNDTPIVVNAVITAVPSSNLGFCVDDVGPSSLIVVDPRQRRSATHSQYGNCQRGATPSGVSRLRPPQPAGRAPAVVREQIIQRVRDVTRAHLIRPRPLASGRTRVACSDLTI